MWKLTIADDQGQKTVVNLVRDEYLIGRSDNAPIRLTERNVSREHACIRRAADGISIEDRSSYNGVFVNGVRVVGKQMLAHRDLIQVGDYRVEVVDEAIDTQEQGYRPHAASPMRPASGRLPHRLVVLVGLEQGQEFALDEADRFLIGRGSECDFRLDHSSVSRVHAEVRELSPGQYEILDKGSANGIRINGQERTRSLLDGRDVIELGDVVLKYIPHGQVFHASPAEGQRIAILGGGRPAPPRSRRQFSPALAAGLFGAIVVGAAGLALVPNDSSVPSTPEDASDAMDAESLLERGDILGAHEAVMARTNGDGSLSAATIEQVERRWAEMILTQAESEPDRQRRRELLDSVTRTPTVPGKLRQRALSRLQALDRDTVTLDGTSDTASSAPSAP